MKISFAQLHDALFIPGVNGGGNLPRTIDPKHTGPIEMELNEAETGVWVQWKGAQFLIPLSNFQAIILAKE